MRTKALIGVTFAVIAVGVVVASFTVLGASDRPTVVTSQAYYVWGDQPRDWVSWADEIAIVNVVGEEPPAHDPRFPRSEGWVGRWIEATVEETIWTRAGSPGVPASVKLRTTDGWSFQDGRFIPAKDVGSHRSEIGDRLLVAMFHSKNWGWTLMSGGVPVDVDARLRAEADQTDIGEELDGMTLPQLAQTFRSAKPFPDVVRFQHLDPEERMIAVDKYANRNRRQSRDG